jgi:hypothetical protein
MAVVGVSPLALPGPSRANTRPYSRPPRGGLQAPVTSLNRTVGINGVGNKAETSSRNAGFHVVSSYLQFLMELCVNLSQVSRSVPVL